VQERMCDTCVYRKESPLDAKELEKAVQSPRGDFDGFRICHSSKTACCAGFWARNKDAFALGQVAQRLGRVQFVQDNVPTRISQQVARLWQIAQRRRGKNAP
jgi:hypothetical protein